MKIIQIYDLFGYDNRKIIATYWQSGETKSSQLACVFPGYSYSTEAPVLFYLKLLFINSNYDWLSIDYRYNENKEFNILSEEDRMEYFNLEQEKIFQFIKTNYAPTEIVWIGKSLGSVSVKEKFKKDTDTNNTNKIILLTPISECYSIANDIKKTNTETIVIIGDKDPFYESYINSDLSRLPNVKTNIIKDAGHIFENINEDIEKSINNIGKVISLIKDDLQFGT